VSEQFEFDFQADDFAVSGFSPSPFLSAKSGQVGTGPEDCDPISVASSGPALTAERLRELLDYDAETGIFRWKVKRRCGSRGWVRPGDAAGCISSLGYVLIGISGKTYCAHRLAWLYVYGGWPAASLDHADRDRANNRIANLREATPAQNQANMSLHRDNRLGVKGVSMHGERYRAQIYVKGRRIHLGCFESAAEAREVYNRAATEHFGEFANVGMRGAA